jgi:hypothetical protein
MPRCPHLHDRLRSVHGRRIETAHFLGLTISTIRRLRHGKEPVGPIHSEHLDFPPLPRRPQLTLTDNSTPSDTLLLPRYWRPQRVLFRHSHGGTGCGSAHKPFLASRASFSNPSSTVSPGACFRYHQHQPCLINLPFRFNPSGIITSPAVPVQRASGARQVLLRRILGAAEPDITASC